MTDVLGAALHRPRRTVALAVAAGVTLTATTWAFGLVTAPDGTDHDPVVEVAPPGTATTPSDAPADPSVVPAADLPATGRLEQLARLLERDPAAAARAREGVQVRYLPDPTGTRVAGQFAVAGASGACYVLDFSADRRWVLQGDQAGLLVIGPHAAAAASCDPT